MSKRKTKARQCSKNERNLLYRTRVQRNYQEREEKTGKTYGSNHAVQKTKEHHESDCKAEQCIRENSKTMYGCVVESREPTRQRAESPQSKKHEDHIAGKGFTSMSHCNLAHRFIPMPQAMKIPDAKAAVDGQGDGVPKACPQQAAAD